MSTVSTLDSSSGLDLEGLAFGGKYNIRNNLSVGESNFNYGGMNLTYSKDWIKRK